jgi:N-acetylglutamate synthase-like GNAT family acetyltransferase
MREEEHPAVERILEDLELGHPSIPPDRFWVALDAGEIVGVSNLARYGSSLYLSAVGVPVRQRGRRVAIALLGQLLRDARMPVYLYTRIPKFFARLGFVPAPPSLEIPPRSIYGCEACGGAGECISMVRRPDAPGVS